MNVYAQDVFILELMTQYSSAVINGDFSLSKSTF